MEQASTDDCLYEDVKYNYAHEWINLNWDKKDVY